MPDSPQSYLVHTHLERFAHGRRIDADSFEDAALEYFASAHPAAEDEVIVVVVREEASGQEQCFRVDLETGQTGPCD